MANCSYIFIRNFIKNAWETKLSSSHLRELYDSIYVHQPHPATIICCSAATSIFQVQFTTAIPIQKVLKQPNRAEFSNT